MSKRIILSFAAVVVIGTTSAAFSYEDPDNKIGDRYPLLEETYQANAPSRPAAKLHASRSLLSIQLTDLRLTPYEDPENKIGDRYPLLEQAYQANASTLSAGKYLANRSVMATQVTDFNLYTYEDPENKIGDRFPFLEPKTVVTQRAPVRTSIARHGHATRIIR
jgi:hypothetical protein